MIGVRHTSGCGEIAFYFLKRPKTGDIFMAENAVHTDKVTHFKGGDKLVCTSCWHDLKGIDLTDESLIDERD